MDCFGRNFECLYGCDLSCIAFTEIITATSMLTLRLRDCSGNKCRFSPGLVLRLLRAVWKTIGTGCQVEGFSFSSPPQRSQRCLCSLSSRFGSLSAVEPHLTFVLFSCGRCMQYRITAMWEMMQRAVCCSSSQGTQSSGFLMVSQLPDVASEMFILSAV